MKSKDTADVVIIGGGIIGCATAYYLSRHFAGRVVLLERRNLAEGNSIFEFFKQGRLYDYVIYVCDKETEDRCPVFPGVRRTQNWPFPDPAKMEGSHEEKLAGARKIRDAVRSRIETWIKEL